MEIQVKWQNPMELKDVSNSGQIYRIEKMDDIPNTSGCYVFYRQHGSSYSILYIGKADKLKNRIKQQLDKVRLMQGIRTSLNGNKYVMYCEIQLKRGQVKDTVLKLLEQNLIERALSDGHDLLNIQGTKVKYNEITLKGNRHSNKLFGNKINFKKHQNKPK